MVTTLTPEMQYKILGAIGRAVKLRAKQLCPVDEGQLMASIDYRIEGDTVIIFSPLSYATDMEYGKPPEPLSTNEKEDLTKWAKRHGMDSGYGIIKSIEKKGIKVGTPDNPIHITSFGRDSYRPFLRTALYQTLTQSNVNKIAKEALK